MMQTKNSKNVLLKTELYDRFGRLALSIDRTPDGAVISAHVADYHLDKEQLGHLVSSLSEMHSDLPPSEEELIAAELLGVCECCDCSDEQDCTDEQDRAEQEPDLAPDRAELYPELLYAAQARHERFRSSLLDEGPDL